MTKVEQPVWFKKAISNEPKKLSIKVKGVKIAYNAWGEKIILVYFLFMEVWLMLIGGIL